MRAEVLIYHVIRILISNKCLHCIAKTKEFVLLFQYFWKGLYVSSVFITVEHFGHDINSYAEPHVSSERCVKSSERVNIVLENAC